MFHEILVVDYITDFKRLTSIEIDFLSKNLIDPQFFNNCPNGTIIGIPIDGNSNNQKKVYYPLLSHISMPIKSGERAWAFDQKSFQVSYWLSRKVQNTSAEDLNFTHDDRSKVFPFISQQKDDLVKNSKIFFDAQNSVLKLKNVRSESISRAKEFIGEPVSPAASKSSDLTFQGSNGTLINLSNNSSKKSATIEIIAGLSSTYDQEIVTNTENYDEIIKPINTVIPSYKDSSRLTVSQRFNADKYYDFPDDDAGDIPTISLKTDAVRILSNNDLKIVVGPEDSQSRIYIKNDGNIVITPAVNKQIKLSGDDSNQPYILYDVHSEVITEIENAVTQLQGALAAIALSLDTLTSGAASSALITPNISINTSIANINSAMSRIGSKKILGS